MVFNFRANSVVLSTSLASESESELYLRFVRQGRYCKTQATGGEFVIFLQASESRNGGRAYHGLGEKRNSLLISRRAEISVSVVTIEGRKLTFIEDQLCARHRVGDFGIFHRIFTSLVYSLTAYGMAGTVNGGKQKQT